MKKVLYITILACSTLWGSCTEKYNNHFSYYSSFCN